MSNKVLKIILIVVLFLTTGFIIFTIATHHSKVSVMETTNIKKGDIYTYDDITVEVLNVAKITCSSEEDCENYTEVSVKVTYNNEDTYYRLNTLSNSQQRITNSNYYLLCYYDNNKLKIDVKDKTEV